MSVLKLQGLAAECEQVGRLVESQIGLAGLQSYLCDNSADSRLLRGILEREYAGQARQPRVVVSRFLPRQHTIRPLHAAAGHPRLIDLIEVNFHILFVKNNRGL